MHIKASHLRGVLREASTLHQNELWQMLSLSESSPNAFHSHRQSLRSKLPIRGFGYVYRIHMFLWCFVEVGKGEYPTKLPFFVHKIIKKHSAYGQVMKEFMDCYGHIIFPFIIHIRSVELRRTEIDRNGDRSSILVLIACCCPC